MGSSADCCLGSHEESILGPTLCSGAASDEPQHFLALPLDLHACILAAYLDAACLGRLEATCKQVVLAHCDTVDVWRAAGAIIFFGIEVAAGCDFLSFGKVEHAGHVFPSKPNREKAGWKESFKAFQERATSLNCASTDFPCPRCYFRMDLLAGRPQHGIYVEMCTVSAVPGLLFGISGGPVDMNSFAFYPLKGQVREISLLPELGMFSNFKARADNLLPALSVECFCGRVGFYLSSSVIVFFRQQQHAEPLADQRLPQEQTWETTGFIPVPSWAKGQRLSAYVGSAALNGGPSVRVTQLGSVPPLWPVGLAQ